jgi:hypothetical protein
MKANKVWLGYAAIYALYTAWVYFELLALTPEYVLSGEDIFHECVSLVLLISIIGLGLQRRILVPVIWKIASGFSLFLAVGIWFVNPYIAVSGGHLTLGQALLVQLYTVPELPLLIGAFIYAWRSPNIWSHDAQQGVPADGPRPAGEARG